MTPRARTTNPAAVLAMDAAALLLFALLARIAHNSEELPLSLPGVLSTWWPFLIGGLIGGAVVLGIRRPPAAVSPSGIIVWIIAVVVGLGIWGIRHGQVPHISFIIVASTTSAILLLGWRAIAAASARRAARR